MEAGCGNCASARLTLTAFSEKTGIPAPSLQKYEAGILRISARQLYDVSQALNVPVACFFEQAGIKAASREPSRTVEAGEMRQHIQAAIADIDDPAILKLLFRMISTYRQSAN